LDAGKKYLHEKVRAKMNEALSWIAYRWFVGIGTLLVGISAYRAVGYLGRIATALEKIIK
jgi:hypothetical protein